MKRALLTLALTLSAQADPSIDHPTGNRTTPPTLNSVAPRGISRGTTAELTVEGLNLAKTSAIYFDRAGIKGRILRVKELPDQAEVRLGSAGTPSTIDLGPLPPRNQVTVEVDVSPEAQIGEVNFRLLTPLGTTPAGRFLVEPYYGETADREPNNTIDEAVEVYLPTILVGEIGRPGDTDHYKITVKAGERLVFDNGGAKLGSSLMPVVSILKPDQSILTELTEEKPFAHTFQQAGTYYVRIADYQKTGRSGHLYRMKVGNFPVAVSAYPLGMQKGRTAEVALTGFALESPTATVKGEPNEDDLLRYRPGNSFSEIMLAIGEDPEVPSTTQQVTIPVTVNGRIDKGKQDTFRFRAAKGQKVVFEVMARRLGSELDSYIEVLDAKGSPIETASVRSTFETFTVLRDHDSAGRGIRIQSWTGMETGDYVMIGSEIMRIEAMPKTPDDDVIFEAFGGQRISYFGTSPESHAIDRGVYKVQMHPPGKQFTANGLPIVRLQARNDDGGPGYSKDSYLEFTAPADGEYQVRISDVRGLGGSDYAYRLNIRNPRPDFRLSVAPRNPNVPAGGTVPVTVTALRKDGFNGKIDIVLEGLPAGITASPAAILPGQVSTTVLLTAAADAKLTDAVAMNVRGQAGANLAHYADPADKLKLIALMPAPDVVMNTQTREVVLEPGKTSDVLVSILRQNGFGGRVPVEVRNLPPRVRVLDVGLNGVLINEDEKQRSFTIEALPNAEPVETMIYVAAKVETRSPLDTSYAAPTPILLKVKKKSVEQTSASVQTR